MTQRKYNLGKAFGLAAIGLLYAIITDLLGIVAGGGGHGWAPAGSLIQITGAIVIIPFFGFGVATYNRLAGRISLLIALIGMLFLDSMIADGMTSQSSHYFWKSSLAAIPWVLLWIAWQVGVIIFLSKSARFQNQKDKTLRFTHRSIWFIISFSVFVVACFLFSPFAKRTVPGRLVRFFVMDEPMGRQIANDLADDVREKQTLASLQNWSEQTLSRYKAGQIATNGPTAYWSRGTVKLVSSEIPSWVSGGWSAEAPEVSIRLSDAGEPECIVICWYLHGLLVGSSNYAAELQTWYVVQAKPGIYAYYDYK